MDEASRRQALKRPALYFLSLWISLTRLPIPTAIGVMPTTSQNIRDPHQSSAVATIQIPKAIMPARDQICGEPFHARVQAEREPFRSVSWLTFRGRNSIPASRSGITARTAGWKTMQPILGITSKPPQRCRTGGGYVGRIAFAPRANQPSRGSMCTAPAIPSWKPVKNNRGQSSPVCHSSSEPKTRSTSIIRLGQELGQACGTDGW
jgi:hypothetical protein